MHEAPGTSALQKKVQEGAIFIELHFIVDSGRNQVTLPKKKYAPVANHVDEMISIPRIARATTQGSALSITMRVIVIIVLAAALAGIAAAVPTCNCGSVGTCTASGCNCNAGYYSAVSGLNSVCTPCMLLVLTIPSSRTHWRFAFVFLLMITGLFK